MGFATAQALAAEQLGGGAMDDPADFGTVVAFVCSEPARFGSGAALPVDGAATTALS